MNSKLLSFLKYLLLLMIAVALLFFAFRGVDLKKTIQDILHANMFWVSLSAFLSLIAMVSRAYRWNLLIESAGYSSPLRKTFYSLAVGYFANLALPRLGEVSRCGSLSKATSIPFTNLLGTVIVERIIDVISLLICIMLAAILEYKKLGNFLQHNILQPIIDKFQKMLGSPIMIAALVILFIAFIVLIAWLIKRSKEKGHPSKWVDLGKSFIDGLRSVAQLKKPWLFIFHSVFIWALYFLGGYVCFFALPPTSNLELSAALLILVASGLGMSAPVQGGIGAFHLLVSQGLILYGLSQQEGLTFATLLHGIQLMLVVIVGVISLMLLFVENKRKTAAIEKNV